MGGLGLRSLSGHSPAAFISSLTASGFGSPDNIHLQQAVAQFNSQVSQHDAVTVEDVSLLPHIRVAPLRNWIVSLFNLYFLQSIKSMTPFSVSPLYRVLDNSYSLTRLELASGPS